MLNSSGISRRADDSKYRYARGMWGFFALRDAS